ncbi:hypothetical protein Tcan_09921 [Toxocara canis]|uniref:Nose resistant to fluoxetine protein 6 n=1 Tax=Toxocara canis TaxID=6265 RepID=A0A0B2UZ81_TOXCA|nr:hypothetical protein Tcan_09921 [Toxocara canis]
MPSLVGILLWFVLVNYVTAKLNSFSEQTIFGFLESAAKTNVSWKCADSLKKIKPFLSNYDTIEDQKKFLTSSYSVGMTYAVEGRDQFRWIYKMQQCHAVAGEKTYAHSEHPTEYCIGRDSNSEPSRTYGICLPQPCHEDRHKLLEEWKDSVGNSSHPIEVHSVECRRSRREKHWLEMWPSILDYSITFTFILIVGLATAYDITRGGTMAECGESSTAKKVFLAYSLKKNGKKLIALPKDTHTTMTCMFGIRFFSMAWVIGGHSFVMAQQLESTYIQPQYRIGPYMVGLLVGYYLARISMGLSKYCPSKSMFTAGSVCAVVAGFCSLYGSYPLMQVYLMHGFGILARYAMLPFPLTYAGYGLLWDCFIQILFCYFIALFTLFIAEYPCVHLVRLLCKRIMR